MTSIEKNDDPPLVPSKGLQKAWTSLMENFQHGEDWKVAPNSTRARWHSSSGKGATGWLNKLPGVTVPSPMTNLPAACDTGWVCLNYTGCYEGTLSYVPQRL